MSVKIYRAIMLSEVGGTHIVQSEVVLAKNKKQATDIIQNRWKLENTSDVALNEIEFKVAHIDTYFSLDEKDDRKKVIHECSNCKHEVNSKTYVGSFCLVCDNYLAYEVLDIVWEGLIPFRT